MQTDKLEELFALQSELQKRLGYDLTLMQYDLGQRVDYVKLNVLACTDELHEVLRETPWKPWKQKAVWNEVEVKDEIVDAWHFLINLTLASGMDAEELHIRFTKKNQVNHERQDEGY